MKVVLFCGGRGIRLREVSESIPKPMVAVGYRPILWHVMRYYAHFGHRDFILCLGYRGSPSAPHDRGRPGGDHRAARRRLDPIGPQRRRRSLRPRTVSLSTSHANRVWPYA